MHVSSQGDHLHVRLGPGAQAVFTTGSAGSLRQPENRTRLERELGVQISSTRQVHGSRVIRVEAPADEEADGQATTVPGLGVLVTVADCLPIALAAPGAVAILHAGWRGLAGGVIAAGAGALRELGHEPLRAAIGPGAGPCCYEVGDEVRAAFPPQHGRTLDLKAIAAAQLREQGVEEVLDCGLCTICSQEPRFFSHRRDGGLPDRQAGVAWLS